MDGMEHGEEFAGASLISLDEVESSLRTWLQANCISSGQFLHCRCKENSKERDSWYAEPGARSER